jgi:structural maintenance of chromosome 4
MLRSQSKPDAGDEKRIVQLEREIATATKEVDSLKAKAAVINDQIKELQNKILEVGGVQLRAMQSKVTTTKGLIDNCNETITKAEVAQAKAQRDAEKLEKAIAANTAKLEEAEAELETVEGDLQACSGDLEVIKAKVQEALDAVETVQEALAASKAELDEKLQFINEFRAIEVSRHERHSTLMIEDGDQAED